MRIWIYLNGIQQGPYTLDEIAAMDLQPSTPVWYEGITQWMPASEAPATAELFGSGRAEGEQSPQVMSADSGISTVATANHRAVSTQDAPPYPKTYMGWSIFATLCCCLIGGIIAIILTSQVSNYYNQGEYERAAKKAEQAEWAIILSIVLGIIYMPVSLAMYL